MDARPIAVAPSGFDLGPLDALTAAVEAGAGLPDVVRAAAAALDASLIVADRAGSVLAVATRSSADERALRAEAEGVEVIELRVSDAAVGRVQLRGRHGAPPPSLLRIVVTLIASEVERLRAPDRASEAAQADLLRGLLGREPAARDAAVARVGALGVDLSAGATVIVVRTHHYAATEDDSRARVLAAAVRGTRGGVPDGVLAAVLDTPAQPGGQIVVLLGGASPELAERVAVDMAAELHASLHGFTHTLGRSRPATDPTQLARAGHEALLAANVAERVTEGGAPTVLAFEATGAYRLLLPAMSEDPDELQRFYGETVEPLVAYDEQYETDLVLTLSTFLDADGNVAGTSQRLFTHRHTIRYRLERIRELCGLDVGSTDGREKLGLGLKAMAVLGIAAARGPASEAGAGGGRVRRSTKDRESGR